jgi:hypothetical protein
MEIDLPPHLRRSRSTTVSYPISQLDQFDEQLALFGAWFSLTDLQETVFAQKEFICMTG